MIRWLTPEIGTSPHEGCTPAADTVIVDVRNLVDREGNSIEAIRSHIDRALAALTVGRRVVLCCDHGISRSNAIAVAVIAQHQGRPFDDVLQDVLAAHGDSEIRVEVLAAVRAALPLPLTDVPNKNTRILITGATGSLGNILASTAPAGLDLFLPTRTELDLSRGAAPIDLYLRRNGITRVLHYAQPRIVNTNDSFGQSLIMLRNVLDACVVNGASVFYPSTWHVFTGYQLDELTATEATPPRPATCLGDTKYLSEALLAQYIDRQGLAATVLRSGTVLGSGTAPHFIRTICRRALQGERVTTHCYDNGLPALDFLVDADYAAAVWGLLEAGHQGTFHAGSGQLLSTQQVARQVVSALGSSSLVELDRVEGRNCNIRIASGKLSQLGWRPLLDPEFAISQYATNYAANTEAARGHR